jgi:hypothetical protein
MESIEATIKGQYARFFRSHDWRELKAVAEQYLETAAKLKTKDIIPATMKLLFRNIQKRLFLGIASELLLKALYLKCGYCINKPKEGVTINGKFPYKFVDVRTEDFDEANTFTLDRLIQGLRAVHPFNEYENLVKGLRTAKVFRNKEGHVAVFWHHFDPQNYRDIAEAIRILYREGFQQELVLEISITPNQNSQFRIIRTATQAPPG